MKKLLRRLCLLTLISILSHSYGSFAQNNLPPVYEIKNDTGYTELPNTYWQMLEDKDGKLTIEQVMQSPVANKFHFNASKGNEFDLTIHTYWFRYSLKNTMNRDANISFNTNGEESDFYFISTGNKITEERNGFLTPWSELNGLKQYKFLPVTLKPGEELIVYNRVHNSYTDFPSFRVFFIAFGSTQNIIQSNYIENESSYTNVIQDSILFGVLALAALFNFFFFLIVRERVYFYFAAYLIVLGIGRMFDEFYFIFFREHPSLGTYFFMFIYSITFFLLTFFIRSLLQTRIYLPRWDKFLVALNFFYIIIDLSSFLDPYLFSSWETRTAYNAFGIAVHILLIGCNILSFFLILKKHDKQNKIIFIAILPAFAIWGIGYSINIVYGTYRYYLLPHAFVIWLSNRWYFIETFCLSWLVVFYLWVLLHRFSELRKQIAQQALEKEIERSQLIAQQKIELEQQVEERTSELKQSLNDLKTTQSQLIQSEKMASLGELTAGIAHEIQNPLNFVNNFSEVNTELIEEADQEIDKGNVSEVKIILNDIKENEQKINHHGKRADAIVKGMLQHSRSSTGVKEPTDVNTLADEYLRLSYHGLRAKDKEFNAIMNTDFDESIGKINIVPQDIGRVLLNLYNNAFYAVSEKKKQRPNGYEPTISVGTKKINDKIQLTVSDNGNGIPQKVLDKIFQPFFTTKPTGEGTGLGLSLAYDIIKAHGGEIKVQTKEGEGSEFKIELPIA